MAEKVGQRAPLHAYGFQGAVRCACNVAHGAFDGLRHRRRRLEHLLIAEKALRSAARKRRPGRKDEIHLRVVLVVGEFRAGDVEDLHGHAAVGADAVAQVFPGALGEPDGDVVGACLGE